VFQSGRKTPDNKGDFFIFFIFCCAPALKSLIRTKSNDFGKKNRQNKNKTNTNIKLWQKHLSQPKKFLSKSQIGPPRLRKGCITKNAIRSVPRRPRGGWSYKNARTLHAARPRQAEAQKTARPAVGRNPGHGATIQIPPSAS